MRGEAAAFLRAVYGRVIDAAQARRACLRFGTTGNRCDTFTAPRGRTSDEWEAERDRLLAKPLRRKVNAPARTEGAEGGRHEERQKGRGRAREREKEV